MALGEVNFWWETRHVARVGAGLWFVTFTFALQVLMNMLLALIMDVYADTKANVASLGDHAETLVSQGEEIWSRYWGTRNGKLVPLDTILSALDPTPLDDGDDNETPEQEEEPSVSLTPDILTGMVPGMGPEQAKVLLHEAEVHRRAGEAGEESLSLAS